MNNLLNLNASHLSDYLATSCVSMIAHLSGILFDKSPNLVVVETGGVGYEVSVPLSSYYQAGEIGGQISLHIQMVVREDAMLLFGFITKREKEIFIRLINISGIGPKLAITILSGLSPDELLSALRTGDVRRLSAIPGIGKKTAERLVVELREKAVMLAAIGGDPAASPSVPATEPFGEDQALTSDLISALVNLGWQTAAAEKAVNRCLQEETRRDFAFLLKQSMKQLYR